MSGIQELQSLGFSMPSPAYLVGAVLFGLLGYAAWRYGKRAGRGLTRWLGVALMLYPYAIAQTWLLYLIGFSLCAGVLFDSR